MGNGETSWLYKPGREVKPDPDDKRIEILPEGSLVFHITSKEDEGFYQCSVKTSGSNLVKPTNSHWAYLKVLGAYIYLEQCLMQSAGFLTNEPNFQCFQYLLRYTGTL